MFVQMKAAIEWMSWNIALTKTMLKKQVHQFEQFLECLSSSSSHVDGTDFHDSLSLFSSTPSSKLPPMST